jgi:hypothetical protein
LINTYLSITYKDYSRGSMTLCQIAHPTPKSYNQLTLVGS